MSRDNTVASPGYGDQVSTSRLLTSFTTTVYSATRGAICMRVVCKKSNAEGITSLMVVVCSGAKSMSNFNVDL